MSIFSRQELENLKSEIEEPGRPAGPNAIVDRVLPLQRVAAKKPAIYTMDDDCPQPETPVESAKAEPVAAPVPVKKKKVVIIDENAGTRKVEYR